MRSSFTRNAFGSRLSTLQIFKIFQKTISMNFCRGPSQTINATPGMYFRVDNTFYSALLARIVSKQKYDQSVVLDNERVLYQYHHPGFFDRNPAFPMFIRLFLTN